MERRVFVAILLSFAVLYGYQALFVPPQKPTVDVVEPKERAAQPVPQATPQAVEQPPAEQEPAAQVSDSAEREIVVQVGEVFDIIGWEEVLELFSPAATGGRYWLTVQCGATVDIDGWVEDEGVLRQALVNRVIAAQMPAALVILIIWG